METKTTISIKCPHCGAELEIDLNARSNEEVAPTEPSGSRFSFDEMIESFNYELEGTGHKSVVPGMDIYNHLQWVYETAHGEWKNDEQGFFNPKNYPEVYSYLGHDDSTEGIAYDAMQSWLMAIYLARICPTWGEVGNAQTDFFRLAYEIGGECVCPLFGAQSFRANPYIMRIVAGKLFAYTVGHEVNEERWDKWREELGGQRIPASCWEELGYKSEELRDESGWRQGYKTKQLGWLVDTDAFIPDAPWPRVEGTTVCNLDSPWVEGQPEDQFNHATKNYFMDEFAYEKMVESYNMMAQTALGVWESYSVDKKNILVNAAATSRCTMQYMFGAPKHVRLVLDNAQLPFIDGYYRYVFEECEDSDLVIDGPFSDLAGIYRYNVHDGEETAQEMAIKNILEIADNCRFPTQDPNYGRCRPGCAPTHDGGERNPIHGAAENELYNISISCMVADTDEQKEKWSQEDGFAADSPRSYVSGHSAQVMAMALMLGEMMPDRLNRYVERAYRYSSNRYVERAHWLSDVIYGRIFGTIAATLIGAMDGMQDGLKSIKEWMENPTPQPEPIPTDDCRINIVMRNYSGRTATLNGEMCLVLANPDKNGVYYGWEGCYNRTGHIIFMQGGLVLQDGEEYQIDGVSMANGDVTVRGRNLLSADLLPIAGRPSNVLLYDLDGNSENFVPQPVDPNIVFENGMTIELIIE